MPEVTISLPVMIGLVILLLAIGAGVVYAVLQTAQPEQVAVVSTATLTPTVTVTLQPSQTPVPTDTPTPLPSPTPLTYKVAQNDTCLIIADMFKVSWQAIVTENQLNATCSNLRIGQELRIPQPTPTPSPQPTATLDPTQAAEQACEKIDYLVKETDTLSSIALTYGVTQQAIRDFNALPSDVVYLGMTLKVPLCNRGPVDTPTPTPIPPYPAPNLLLPADGASFSATDVITLQWASVGELRASEAYAVTLEDIGGQKVVEYVTDTKYILPDTLRPTDGRLHLFRWSILPVRQIGSDKDSGKPVWEPAGTPSAQRVFGWMSGAAPATSP